MIEKIKRTAAYRMENLFQLLEQDLDRLFSTPSELRKLVEKAEAEVGQDLAKKLSAYAINKLVNAAPHRPHQWSTVSDYTSWRALTDKTYSARALPAYKLPLGQEWPAIADVVKLFERPAGQQVLSNKSTCLFPSFAQYLTDGFIRTKMPHKADDQSVRKQNTSNHEIDLCTLYGRKLSHTDSLRLKSREFGWRGRLKSQIVGGEEFSPFLIDPLTDEIRREFEALDPPLALNNLDGDPQRAQKRAHIFAAGGDRVNTAPQVAMMNNLFLREHNRLAGAMENAHRDWDDERVFQTARNTVIVEAIKIVVEDYMNHITPAPIKFVCDPSVAWEATWNKPNWITTEFSLLYRWHSLIPDEIVWNQERVPVGETFLNNELLTRSRLADAFASLSAQKAGHLGLFNTADPLWVIEQDSVMQGRICEVAPFADYCRYVSRPTPKSFADISKNPPTQEMLEKIYTTVDRVEFYPGLFAEDLPDDNSTLPGLITAMVAVDAFSQALTNPLLSQYVFHEETFSEIGWEAINTTSKLGQIVDRNCADLRGRYVSMTQADWKFDWDAFIP